MNNKFEWTDERVLKFCFQYQNKSILDYEKLVKQFIEEESKTIYPEGIFSVKDKFGNIIPYDGLPTYQFFCNHHIKNGDTIHSVKNTSGTILTVGDKTNAGEIKGFRISEYNTILARIKEPDGSATDWNIVNLEIAKPLYKTTDNFEVDGDTFVYRVGKDNHSAYQMIHHCEKNFPDDPRFKRFPNAEIYMDKCAKKHSDKDIDDAFKKHNLENERLWASRLIDYLNQK